MRKIRVLVVEDSVVGRHLISNALEADPALEVVGMAKNGRVALEQLSHCAPDLVTLDIEMPELDGLETLRRIRKRHATLPVIMFSAMTRRGALATLEALAIGASDYVTKPASVGEARVALQRVRDELVPKIKALCHRWRPDARFVPTARSGAKKGPRRRTVSTRPLPRPAGLPHIVAIGASTGGPGALEKIMAALPADFPAPIVIAQHMPPMFTKLLAERLDAKSAMRVVEAADCAELQRGVAYVAPGDHHMTVRRHDARVVVALDQNPPEHSCRPAVDVLFNSVAGVYQGGSLGVVLTGMGKDGLRGCGSIRAVGGHVLVQDGHTSVVFGMPAFVAEAGLANQVVALPAIAGQLCRLAFGTSRGTSHDAGHDRSPAVTAMDR